MSKYVDSLQQGESLIRESFERPVEVEDGKCKEWLRSRTAALIPEGTPAAAAMAVVNRASNPAHVIGATADGECLACKQAVWRAPSLRASMQERSTILLCTYCLTDGVFP